MTRFALHKKNKSLSVNNELVDLESSRVSKKISSKRIILVFFSAIFVISSVASLLLPMAAQAATLTSKSNLKDQVYAYTTYNAMIDCLGQDQQQMDTSGFLALSLRTSEGHLKSGDWWRTEGSAYWGTTQGAESADSFINPKVHKDSGNALCNDIVKAAAPLFGYDSIFKFACAFIDTRANGSSCETGSGDFKELSPNIGKFKTVIGKQVWGSKAPSLTLDSADKNAGLYIIYREAFLDGCSPKVSDSPADNFAYKNIRIISDDGTDTTKTYEGLDRGTSRNTYRSSDSSTESKNCGEIASLVNKYASDYKAYLKDNPTDTGTTQGTIDCSNATYAAAHKDECANKDTATCGIDGIGWIICPVLTFVGGITSTVYDFISNDFLQVNIGLVSDSSTTHAAWGIMRSIANVAFVIVFLIIIFSQMTSLGVSNYGVKKLLPRLVIAAILVNLSFFICQIAVDLSNILGSSLNGALSNLVPASSGSGGDDTGNAAGWTAIVAVVIAAGAVAYFSLAILIPILLGALIAVLMIGLMLIARQAIIVILIVLAPLAFVAFMLPNTQQWFDKWRKLFFGLLLLYPVIAIVFGASKLASNIMSTITISPGSGGDSAELIPIIALGVAALPLFIVPSLLKSSLNGIGAIGGKLSTFANKAGGGLGKVGSKGFANTALARGRALRQQSRANYRSEKFAKDVAKGGARSLFARGANITGAQKYANSALERTAASASLKAEAEEVAAAKALITQQANLSGAQRQELALTGKTKDASGKVYSGATMQRAAIETQMATGSYGEQQAIINASSVNKEAGGLKEFSRYIGQGVPGIVGKDPAFAGASIDKISQGKYDYTSAVKTAITDGRYSSEAFATMNDKARADAIAIARKAEADGDSTYMNALRKAAEGIKVSAEISAKVAGNPVAEQQLAELVNTASGPTSIPTNGVTPPTTSNGASGPGGLIVPGDDEFKIR